LEKAPVGPFSLVPNEPQRDAQDAHRNAAQTDGPLAHFLFVRPAREDGPMNDRELANLLAPAAMALGLELAGVERVASRGGGMLRVYLDAPGRAVTLDDCEAASREFSALLDLNDPIAGRYTLEVSSPGLERPLFTPEQFARFVGTEARVELVVANAGRRRLQGRILAVQGERITLEQDGAPVEVPHGNVAKAHLKPDYGQLFGEAKRKAAPVKPRKPGRNQNQVD
jgi:ribosome maturation factor RimP